MISDSDKLVISINFYRANKTWLDIKAKTDEKTNSAIQSLKQIIGQKIEKLKKDIENLDNKICREELLNTAKKSREFYDFVSKELKCDWNKWKELTGHRKEYLGLLNAKLKTYKNLLE